MRLDSQGTYEALNNPVEETIVNALRARMMLVACKSTILQFLVAGGEEDYNDQQVHQLN